MLMSPRPSPVTVSRLGFGAAPLAKLFSPVSEAEAHATIQAALAAGLTFIDTAPFYGTGLSEKRVGAAIRGLPRDQIVIETKVGRLVTVEDLPADRWDEGIVFDYTRDGVRRSLDDSLRRLNTDYVDILLVHDPDLNPDNYRTALDEAFPTLADLRRQGVIKALGAGMNQWEMLWEFARYADPDCFLLAGRYTLLEQTSLDFLTMCQSRDIQIWLGGVFNSGILARGAGPDAKYNYQTAPPEVQARVQRLTTICERHGVPLKTAALHFAAAHPAVKCLILGMESPAEVADNLASWNTPVPLNLWADLQAHGLLADGAPLPTRELP
jgi:D-threo-aldose 1-dehydrogenase